MATYKCIRCGGENECKPGVCKCVHCKSDFVVPRLVNEEIGDLYAQANGFFAKTEFDQATGLYLHILSKDPNDSVVNWMMLLCTYGVNYCKGENSEDWRPTIWRYQPTRIMDNNHYKLAMKAEDDNLRRVFEREAIVLETIRAGIEAKLSIGMPVDVFISYKETDDITKEKTHDSRYARMLYNHLKSDGYSVFYAPITLNDEAGYRFEPYIYSAIHSAKTMIVLGTKADYFNAPWVRNEWERFLSVVKERKEKKKLIPLFAGMVIKDLPSELRDFQVIDIDEVGDWESMVSEKVGETLDIEKLFQAKPLLHGVSLLLEKGKFEEASLKCEKAWEQYPTDAMVYVARLMIKLKIKKLSLLPECAEPFGSDEDYLDAIKFGEKNGVGEMLKGYNTRIIERNKYNEKKTIYDRAVEAMNKADTVERYQLAIEMFRTIEDFDDDVKHCIEECKGGIEEIKVETYEKAMKLMYADSESSYRQASKAFKSIQGYLESDRLANYCDQMAENSHNDGIVEAGIIDISRGNYQQAIDRLCKVRGWKQANYAIEIAKRSMISDRIEGMIIGSKITFGIYPQNNENPSPITWIVLAKEDNSLLLISEYALDCKPYNEKCDSVAWETCSLRQWLNSVFLDIAFTEEEKEMIQVSQLKNDGNPEYGIECESAIEDATEEIIEDKVFLLSIQEAQRYFAGNVNRKCKPTEYAVKKGAYVSDTHKACWWWLRTPGYESISAALVTTGGSLNYYGLWVDDSHDAVRPSLRIKL